MRSHNPDLLAEAVADGSHLDRGQILGRLPERALTDILLGFAIDKLIGQRYVQQSRDRSV